MLFLPCVATISTMKTEMENTKWFLSSLMGTIVLSYLGGIVVYNLALWWKL
ncbi:MAG: hypothetical protein LBV07_03825 [Syntrophobacterales bacterium]|nr:hypothetical protein [Syntrophobacterales bacterium]